MASLHVKVRSPAAVVGLSVITLSLYAYVWYFKVNRELRDFGRARRDQHLATSNPGRSIVAITLGSILIVPAIVSLVGAVGRLRAAERLARRTPRSGALIITALLASTALGIAGTFSGLGLLVAPGFAVWLLGTALFQARLNEVWREAGLVAAGEVDGVAAVWIEPSAG